jgi:hypothetical protein
MSYITNNEKRLVLQADVVNNNAVANTLQNVTGLEFATEPNAIYKVRACMCFDAAATTTGSRWVFNGTNINRVNYVLQSALTTSSNRIFNANALGVPSSSATDSAYTSNNTAILEGLVVAGETAGSIQVQFASEVANSAITAKVGSYLDTVNKG